VEIDAIVDAPPPNLRPRFALDRYDPLGLALLAVLVPLVAVPVLRNMIGPHLQDPRLSDYPSHSAYAAQMRHERRLLLPHPLYHLCLLATQKSVEWITGTSAANIDLPAVGHIRTSDARVLGAVNQAYARAAMTVALAFLLLTAAILWCQARRAVDAANAAAALGCVALVLALMLLGPVSLRHAKDGEYYLGYIGISVWHNPTVLVAKPLSYLLFLRAAQVFMSREETTEQVPWAFATFIVLLCTFAKPNYLLCILPALAIVAAIYRYLHRPVRLRLLIAGIVLPSVAILAWQYYFTFASGAANGITFAPFKVMSALARHDHLGRKLALSILFPVACYVIWLPDSLKSVRLNLAGFAFWVAVAFMYLVAEKKNYTDGNFLWGAQIALFILCAESAFFVVAALRRRWTTTQLSRRWLPIAQTALCAAVFALHLYWGIRYRNSVTHTPGGIYP
jgi:hypothetical protein